MDEWILWASVMYHRNYCKLINGLGTIIPIVCVALACHINDGYISASMVKSVLLAHDEMSVDSFDGWLFLAMCVSSLSCCCQMDQWCVLSLIWLGCKRL